MRLFDKYILSCTNQRIPMPTSWQSSLGIAISKDKQEVVQSGVSSESTGYKFQQDDTLDRGFISHLPRAREIRKKESYVAQLYFLALEEHKQKYFSSYFLASQETIHQFPFYITTAPVVAGKKYSIYGSTLLPGIVEVVLETTGEVLFSEEFSSLSTLAQIVVDTSLITDLVENEEEYLILRVTAYVPVKIVLGVYDRLLLPSEDTLTGFSALQVIADQKKVQGGYTAASLPSVAYSNVLYSDKLIPSLLDMQITSQSPQKERELVAEELSGSDVEVQIIQHTLGLYDVDQYIGGKLMW